MRQELPFDIKYRPQIEAGIYQVVTDGSRNKVTIIKWDAPNKEYPIVGMFENGIVSNYSLEGKDISPSFSGLIIQADKSEFENLLKEALDSANATDIYSSEMYKTWAPKLLEAARKDMQPEIDAEIDKAYKNSDEVQFKAGVRSAMEKLPYWEGMDHISDDPYVDQTCTHLVYNGYRINIKELFDKLPKTE